MKKFKTLFLCGLLGLFIYLGVLWKSDLINMVALLSGVTCVYLAGQRNIHTFTIGIVNSIAYGYISYKSGLNGDAMLNLLFYLPMQFIGLYMWNKHKTNDTEVEVAKMSLRSKIIYFAVSAVLIIGFGLFLSTLKGQNMPFRDSATTILSIVAQFMMLQRFYQQWFVYIGINILSIWIWVILKDNSMILMWSAYLCNSLLGLYTWRKGVDKIE